MKNYGKIILTICIALTVFACSRNQKEMRSESATPDNFKNETSNLLTSSAAIENGKDSKRKFIRTADIKVRVADVIKSTYEIETIVGQSGGFVSNTNLRSDVDNKTSTQVSKDSSIETTYYTVHNSMTLRIPNTKLDSALKSISVLVDYMDYRVIKADDASLTILKNDLVQRRNYGSEERTKTAIDKRGNKLLATIDAEINVYDWQTESDDRRLSNLALMDQVNFSTVSLTIYQKQAIKSAMMPLVKNTAPYEPDLGDQISESLSMGWNVLKFIIVFIARLWSLILLGILIFVGYRIIRRKSVTS